MAELNAFVHHFIFFVVFFARNWLKSLSCKISWRKNQYKQSFTFGIRCASSKEKAPREKEWDKMCTVWDQRLILFYFHIFSQWNYLPFLQWDTEIHLNKNWFDLFRHEILCLGCDVLSSQTIMFFLLNAKNLFRFWLNSSKNQIKIRKWLQLLFTWLQNAEANRKSLPTIRGWRIGKQQLTNKKKHTREWNEINWWKL